MSQPPADPPALLLEAAAFAARAHRRQLRKDGCTPYVSHPFRVCLIVRHVFGIADERILAAALLHDVIEDTTTDCDDLIETFGPEIARWVAVLTKDKRLPEDQREPAYIRSLCSAEQEVQIIKLADVYDNILDSAHLPVAQRRRSLHRYQTYLDGLAPHMTGELRPLFDAVSTALNHAGNGLKIERNETTDAHG
jgi:guanosine-3',5'-bis(diphosphate) 3'-pyrophosphohydrolase